MKSKSQLTGGLEQWFHINQSINKQTKVSHKCLSWICMENVSIAVIMNQSTNEYSFSSLLQEDWIWDEYTPWIEHRSEAGNQSVYSHTHSQSEAVSTANPSTDMLEDGRKPRGNQLTNSFRKQLNCCIFYFISTRFPVISNNPLISKNKINKINKNSRQKSYTR